jgi:transketolase
VAGTLLTSVQIRRVILDRAHAAREGHIGSALSIADIMVVLYRDVVAGRLRGKTRDRVVLSKGHAALALYAALYLSGELSEELLLEYCEDGGRLGIHPQHGIHGVEFTTGSLGQGLSFASGCALAAQLGEEQWRTFVICSDAECDEGATWEAAMFAAQRHLGHLVVVVDYNRQQAMGDTDDVIALGDLRARFEAVGWLAVDVDGHDTAALETALRLVERDGSQPIAVIAHTTFGKGVAFMERQLRWHYSSLSDEDYALAIASLGTTP